MQAVQQSPAMLGLSPAAIAIGEAASTSSSPALESAAVSPQPPPSSEIQRLSLDTIRRISAEQAISDLASIVKELVDNALDAEATTIKSKYRNKHRRLCSWLDGRGRMIQSSTAFSRPTRTSASPDSSLIPTGASHHRSFRRWLWYFTVLSALHRHTARYVQNFVHRRHLQWNRSDHGFSWRSIVQHGVC